MKRLIYILMASALLPLSGCIDAIDFTGEGGEPLLVIFGTLRIGELPSELTIRRTRPTGGPGPNISDALVIITDGTGAAIQMLPDADGVFRLEEDENFMLTEGESYSLEVTTGNGKTYVAGPQTMPPPPPPVDGRIDLNRRTADVWANVDFTNVSETRYLRFTYDHVYSFPEITCSPFVGPKTCYFEETLPVLFTPLADNEGGLIQDSLRAEIFELTQFSDLQGGYWGKHYYNTYPHSITKTSYEYWETINKISNAQGSIFDSTPAVVFGNIHEKDDPESKVLGFFETAQVSVTRPSLSLLDFNIAELNVAPYCPITTLPGALVFNTFDRACCNCLLIEDASLEKPEWFEN